MNNKNPRPCNGRGLMRQNTRFLLFTSIRYTHTNLPTMRGLNVMVVMLARSGEQGIHNGWQYTNVFGNSQVGNYSEAKDFSTTQFIGKNSNS